MAVSNGISIATLPLLIPAKTNNWCKELNKLSGCRPARISMEFQPSLGTRWQIKLSAPGPVGLGLRLQPIDRRLRTPSASASASQGQTQTITREARTRTRTITNAYANEKSPKKKVEVSASGRNIRMSAHKVRRVIDQIRGRSYEETLMILELMPYRACYPIFKIVYSAAANGVHNLGFNEASLVISKAEVNEGMALKRPSPRARGRSDMIKKPTCHVTIVLKDTSLDE